MKLSIIIPWVDHGEPWRRASFRWVYARYRHLFPDAEIVVGSNDDVPFSRSKARNVAVGRATGDILLIADADTVFQKDTIVAAANLVVAGAPWVIPYGEGRYYNLSSEETDLILNQPCEGRVPEPSDPSQWEHKLTSWAGLLVVPRTAFDKVGGYDERFIGWGYEDNAFRYALDNVVGPLRRVVDGYCLHLWHPIAEDASFENPAIGANRELCRQYEQGLLP